MNVSTTSPTAQAMQTLHNASSPLSSSDSDIMKIHLPLQRSPHKRSRPSLSKSLNSPVPKLAPSKRDEKCRISVILLASEDSQQKLQLEEISPTPSSFKTTAEHFDDYQDNADERRIEDDGEPLLLSKLRSEELDIEFEIDGDLNPGKASDPQHNPEKVEQNQQLQTKQHQQPQRQVQKKQEQKKLQQDEGQDIEEQIQIQMKKKVKQHMKRQRILEQQVLLGNQDSFTSRKRKSYNVTPQSERSGDGTTDQSSSKNNDPTTTRRKEDPTPPSESESTNKPMHQNTLKICDVIELPKSPEETQRSENVTASPSQESAKLPTVLKTTTTIPSLVKNVFEKVLMDIKEIVPNQQVLHHDGDTYIKKARVSLLKQEMNHEMQKQRMSTTKKQVPQQIEAGTEVDNSESRSEEKEYYNFRRNESIHSTIDNIRKPLLADIQRVAEKREMSAIGVGGRIMNNTPGFDKMKKVLEDICHRKPKSPLQRTRSKQRVKSQRSFDPETSSLVLSDASQPEGISFVDVAQASCQSFPSVSDKKKRRKSKTKSKAKKSSKKDEKDKSSCKRRMLRHKRRLERELQESQIFKFVLRRCPMDDIQHEQHQQDFNGGNNNGNVEPSAHVQDKKRNRHKQKRADSKMSLGNFLVMMQASQRSALEQKLEEDGDTWLITSHAQGYVAKNTQAPVEGDAGSVDVPNCEDHDNCLGKGKSDFEESAVSLHMSQLLMDMPSSSSCGLESESERSENSVESEYESKFLSLSITDTRPEIDIHSKNDNKVVQDFPVVDPTGRKGNYTGALSKCSGRPNGHGRLIYIDTGDIFIGQFVHGLWTGYGRCIYKNGDDYTGFFLDDVKHGHGVLEHPDGRVFEGTYSHGVRVDGKMTYQDGSEYAGQWYKGVRHGRGTYKFAQNGCVYFGSFRKDTMHGKGVLTWPDGSKFIGEWRHGTRHGEGVEYCVSGTIRRQGLWSRGHLVTRTSSNSGKSLQVCERK